MVVAAAAAAASVFAVCVRVFVEAQRTCGVPAAIKTTTAPVIVVDHLGPAHRCGATTDEAAAAAHGVTVIGIAVGVRGVTATETTAAAAVAAAVATEGMGGTGGGDRCMRGRVCAVCELRKKYRVHERFIVRSASTIGQVVVTHKAVLATTRPIASCVRGTCTLSRPEGGLATRLIERPLHQAPLRNPTSRGIRQHIATTRARHRHAQGRHDTRANPPGLKHTPQSVVDTLSRSRVDHWHR